MFSVLRSRNLYDWNIIRQRIEALSDTDLEEFVKSADRAIRSYEIRTGMKFPKSHHDEEDIVHTVLEKMLNEDRGEGFDPTLGSFSNWVKRSIKSEVKNRMNRKSSSLERQEIEDEIEYTEGANSPSSAPKNPEIEFIRKEKAEAILVTLYKLADGDEELEELILVLDEEGFDLLKKSQELAEILSWDIDRVNNAKKRLDRKLKKAEPDIRSLL